MVDNAETTISFQGIAGAHSDMACKNAYPYHYTLPCDTFESALNVVETGKAALAHIPIENSHAGRVAEIHNLLPETNLSIVGEYFHKVSHALVAPKGATLDTVKTVYSHQQALMQCRAHCRDLGITQEPFFDTAAAAKQVAQWNDPTKAALASHLAAELYGLEILQSDMQDANDNTTLFVAFAAEPIDPDPEQSNVITSLLFTTRNIAAGLYKALGGFATNNINILKLESYIPDYTSGEAQFFITFEGHPRNLHVQHALDELGFFTKNVKLLGVYESDPNRYKSR